ncbi:MAG: ABC transporter ATP-binding protein [Methanothrix sp.]|uniref:Nickel import system ATP-binding protein NikD n=1 Tax=Methanothrix thermoacetophila (strain DSM 6194 / JCM 14653 / NBRC 101360 / PT) TaxID=349307 RepID=A0B7Z4_METTP|nr:MULTISPECIES: ABC transporter ATP-binding protein [Methanothrix]ABK14818.1 oligopeptide/dipeptide ABC transporter, ATPase subunit [Methanothrix thermoacetophila PT]MBC7080350.1 ABC transporter ATP-binding protein [Methanothrix sp.]NPU87008.1 ABC transporter ATP-binding protein [Methanothrix sp.]
MSLLELRGLSVRFETPAGSVKAASDVFLALDEHETLAIVGETGCGKSVIANAILRLLPENASVTGSVIYRGMDLLKMSEREISRIRGREIAIIFQNPSAALNPVHRILDQVSEPLLIHLNLPRHKALHEADRLLIALGLNGAGRLYPFQLSGGMNQRAMIACSSVLRPKILMADEPTKGLDQSMVENALELIGSVRDESSASLIMITHDLDVALSISERIAVMYCGEIVEMGRTENVLCDPEHPYTKALRESMPDRGFKPIPGNTPSMIDPPEGCRFHPRCPFKMDICSREKPSLNNSCGRYVRCWRCT